MWEYLSKGEKMKKKNPVFWKKTRTPYGVVWDLRDWVFWTFISLFMLGATIANI